jgi:DNA-directed RNA polymerase subunit RPC12/RpoP
MVTWNCVQCGKSLRASEELAGRSVRCPRCSARQPVAAPTGGPPPPTPPRKKSQVPVPGFRSYYVAAGAAALGIICCILADIQGRTGGSIVILFAALIHTIALLTFWGIVFPLEERRKATRCPRCGGPAYCKGSLGPTCVRCDGCECMLEPCAELATRVFPRKRLRLPFALPFGPLEAILSNSFDRDDLVVCDRHGDAGRVLRRYAFTANFSWIGGVLMASVGFFSSLLIASAVRAPAAALFGTFWLVAWLIVAIKATADFVALRERYRLKVKAGYTYFGREPDPGFNVMRP